MNPPKFKQGDMVLIVQAPWRKHFGRFAAEYGKIGTIVAAPRQRTLKRGAFWCYPLDRRGCEGQLVPVEPCLRLIRAGDLKLEDTPAGLKEPA